MKSDLRRKKVKKGESEEKGKGEGKIGRGEEKGKEEGIVQEERMQKA